MADIRATVIELSPFAEEVHEHIVEVYNNVQDIQIDTGRVYRFANSTKQDVEGKLIMARNISANATEVIAQHEANYSSEVDEARQVLTDALRVNDEAQGALLQVQMQLEHSQNLSSDYQQLNDSLQLLMLEINNLTYRESDLRIRLTNITTITERLKLNIPEIEHIIRYATDALDSAEQTVRRAEYSLIMVMNDVQTLAAIVGDPIDVPTLMSGDGNTLFSGSGASESEPTMLTPEPMADSIVGSVELLRRAVVRLEQMYSGGAGVRQQAMDHADNVSSMAMQIVRYVVYIHFLV